MFSLASISSTSFGDILRITSMILCFLSSSSFSFLLLNAENYLMNS